MFGAKPKGSFRPYQPSEPQPRGAVSGSRSGHAITSAGVPVHHGDLRGQGRKANCSPLEAPRMGSPTPEKQGHGRMRPGAPRNLRISCARPVGRAIGPEQARSPRLAVVARPSPDGRTIVTRNRLYPITPATRRGALSEVRDAVGHLACRTVGKPISCRSLSQSTLPVPQQ